MRIGKRRTPREIERYMRELKAWLDEARSVPAEEMAAFFTKRIDIYEERHLGNWAEEYAHIADYLDDGCSTLLDIGCGTGLELEAVWKRFPDAAVTGIDLCEAMLAKLREKYAEKRLTAIRADYLTYPFGISVYDAALSFETLHHFTREQKQTIYRKLFRALKEGGCYLECDYIACCEEEERLCLSVYEERRRGCGVPADAFVHIDIPMTLAHQAELIRKAGFSCVRVEYENEGTAILKAIK